MRRYNMSRPQVALYLQRRRKERLSGEGTPEPIPVADPPEFTSQPQAYTFYQSNGLLSVTGADASPATDWQWQKLGSDGTTWNDVAGQTTKTLSIANAATGLNGSYRLKATNENSDPAYSTVAKVGNVYLGLQNDSSPGNGSANGTTKVSNTVYTEDGPAGARYYSAFIKDQATDANITPADWGLTTARARVVAGDWVSTNTSVVPIMSVSAAGQLTTNITTGSAVLTAKYGNLQSVLNVTVG